MVETKVDQSVSAFTKAAELQTDRLTPEVARPTPAPAPSSGGSGGFTVPVQETEVSPEVSPVDQTSQGLVTTDLFTELSPNSMDPEIVADQLSGDPYLMSVNRQVYGDQAIQQAMQARETGNLQSMLSKGMFQPLPNVSKIASASGVDVKTVGYYLIAKDNPALKARMLSTIGESDMVALETAYKGVSDQGDEPTKRGFIGMLGATMGDVAGLVTKNDFYDGTRAGMGAAAADIADLGNFGDWVYNVNDAISKVPGVGDAADWLGITRVQVDVTPTSAEHLEQIKAAIPDYQFTQAGIAKLEDLEVGKRSTLALNPADLRGYNEAFGLKGNEANQQSLEARTEEWNQYVDTVTGGLLSVVTEYGVVYASTPQFTKGATFGSRALNGLLKGAAADNIVYNEGDENLSRMLVEWGVPGSSILELTNLTTNESDTEIMARVKTTLEGAILGVGIETIGYMVLAARGARAGNPEKAIKNFAAATEAEAKTSSEQAKNYVDAIDQKVLDNPDATQDNLEIALAAKEVEAGKEIQEVLAFDMDRLPDWNEMDTKVLNSVDKFVRSGGVAHGDADIINTVLGEGWFDDLKTNKIGNIYTIDADDQLATVSSKIAGVLGKVQEPVPVNRMRGMAAKVLSELDEDMLDPDLLARYQSVDPAQWSTNDAANILAAGMLQRTYVEQMAQIAADISSRADVMDSLEFANLSKRLNALQAQVAILQGGRAKIGRNASHALLALKAEKGIKGKEIAATENARWMRKRNLITAKREAQLIDQAMKNSKNARAQAKVANKVSTEMSFLEKVLQVTNADLLFNTSTQALMIVSNAARVAVRNPVATLVEGAVIEPLTGIFGRDTSAWSRSRSKLAQAWHTYGAMAKVMPDAVQAFGRFWRSGKSQFTKHSIFDERGTFAGKSLAEVRASKADGALDQGVKLAEHVYRFMGSIDEAFKELVVSTDMQVRAMTGDYGPELQAIAQKHKPTTEDLVKWFKGSEHYLETPQGRVVDSSSVDLAAQSMFQSEAVDGSINKVLRDMLSQKNFAVQMVRLVAMRFVATPLNVMEERFATILSGPLLIFGDNKVSRAVAGKFAADLSAVDAYGNPDMRIRSRTRAVLATNSLFMGLGAAYFLYGNGREDDLVDVDTSSPTFGQLKVRYGNGKKRYINTMDMEVPFLNAFVLGRIGAEITSQMTDPHEALEFNDALSVLSAIFINETLEKSSLKNLTDTLGVITDDKFRGAERLTAGNIGAIMPFNWWLTRALELGNGGEFQGKPKNLLEAIGKQVPVFRAFGWGTTNKERNALGELMPAQNRGFNPFVSREFKEDAISEELADIRLTTGTNLAASKFERGDIPYHEMAVDGQSIFDMMQEVIASGEVKIDGYTLREAAGQMISDPDGDYQSHYKQWRDAIDVQPRNSEGELLVKVGGDDVKDPRVARWKSLLKMYREAALQHVMSNAEPELRKRVQDIIVTSEFTEGTIEKAIRK
jgi:hypothetical protein